MTPSNHWLPAFAMGIAATISACGGSPTGPGPTDPGVTVITLHQRAAFSPGTVTIGPGTTVRWVNGTSLRHTVTPADHSEVEPLECELVADSAPNRDIRAREDQAVRLIDDSCRTPGLERLGSGG